MMRFVQVVLLAVAVALPGLARADDAAEAKQAFLTASRFFQAEEYDSALPLFEKAYRLSGQRPATIFGLAQCERALKKYEAARVHFKEYLATEPANAADVRETIQLLDDLIEVRDAAEARRAEEAKAKAAAEAKAAQEAKAKAEAEARAKASAEAEAKAKARAKEHHEGPMLHSETAEEGDIALPPASSAGPPAPPAAKTVAAQPELTAVAPIQEPEDEGGILSSPWFWTIASVVVVSGAVTSGVLLTRGGGPSYTGTSGVVLGD